jgi:photosynthetic reaction center H subunit
MESGAITSYIDVAQLVLYAFWIFFFGLIIYLRREDKREGYPLESSRARRVRIEGFPRMPSPKTFRLPHGGEARAPHPETEPELRAAARERWPGAPLDPTGNPLTDGVGPASYALRADKPDLTIDGQNRIVPLRVAVDFHVDGHDPVLVGMPVYGADGALAGKITDLWIDRSEPQIRYLELSVPLADAERQVLMPVHSALIDAGRGQVRVKAILARQFADAPLLARPDQITLREEDRVSAYFAGGYLYAESSRREPLL